MRVELSSAGAPPRTGLRVAFADGACTARQPRLERSVKGLVNEADGFPTLGRGFRIAGSRADGVPAPSLGRHDGLVAGRLDEPVRTGAGREGSDV
ncbi:hypothetical protein E1287_19735 [Actinomadura sp. KC06]|nr:hypothetical protein E1287_19735 [Actinomadura sp. KC06]